MVVTKDGDKVADASLRSYGKNLTIVFNAGLKEYGQYKVVIPENCVTTALGKNAELPLMFNVGEFAVAQITPSVEEVAKSLSEVTVFMTAPVGGFLDGAKLNVKRDGDVVATATLDWATEPYGNDVRVTFDTTLEEYGKYTIEFPAGVIFDKYYNDVDPIMSGARGNEAFELTYKVGLFEVATIAPSADETAESLSEVTVFMTAPVGGFLDGAKLNVYKDGDTEEAYTTATLDWATEPYGNDVRVTFDTTLEEYGKYTIEFPAGVIFDKYYTDVDPIFSGARGNEAFELTYKVGTFAPVSVLPATDEALESLKEVTVFMSDRVGGVLDGAKLNVYKDGDTEEAYTTATIDILNTNANEATITLADEITEYGKYTIVIPEGIIFDKYYNGEDAAMTGATGNEAFELTYKVGTFAPVSVLPATDEALESLKEVTVFMSDRVGGVLDGAKLNVYKDGDTEEAYTTATIDILNTNANEATITLADEITEYGKYTIVIPEGIIFDKYYNGEDAAMTGATGNEAFELTYKVGTFAPVSVLPATDEALESLKEVTVFMSDRVGGVLDGAKLNVYKDGDTEEAYTTATIDILNTNANEATITLADEITEYGKYTIVIPEGIIFDKYYNGEDAAMTGATGNEAFELTYKVGTFAPVSVLPATDEALESLKEVTVFMSDRVGGVLDGAKLNVYKDGDTEEAYTTATIDILNTNANEATITLADEITEYGKYTIVIPEGIIFDKYYNGEDAAMTGATGNEAFELTYNVGSFEVTTVSPSIEEVATSLKEVTVFMSDRVGGFLDGAKLNVKRDGDVVATATLDWATEPYGNDVRVTFDTTLEEYGKYTIEFPAGVIFDKYYNDVDPIMSGARSNDAFELTYKVGLFEVAAVTPENGSSVNSLKDVTVFMTAPVGGFLDGAELSVTKDGAEVATATLDWATEPYGNDVVVLLSETLTESGVYTIEIPAGVIFDKYYTDVDPLFSGARTNDTIVLTFTVDTSTGISNVTVKAKNSEAVYTLGGMKVGRLVKGINIVNGKKVLVK